MNVEIGAEAALFQEKEYIKGIFVAVHVWLEPRSNWLMYRSSALRSPLRRVDHIGVMSLVVIYSIRFVYIARLSQSEERVSFTCSNCFYLPSRRLQERKLISTVHVSSGLLKCILFFLNFTVLVFCKSERFGPCMRLTGMVGQVSHSLG